MQSQFAIRCSQCHEWTVWHQHPSAFAVRTKAEWSRIKDGLRNDPRGFRHRKMLGCEVGSGKGCPSPVQAFVFASQDKAHRAAAEVPSWSYPSAFRLYKKPTGVDRWNDYCAVSFSTWPVPRQKHIFLHWLFDDGLLRHSLAGMTTGLENPATMYIAETRDDSDLIHWRPLEATDPRNAEVPRRFNPVCRYCRQLVRDSWRKKSKIQDQSLLEFREVSCPCYQSDLKVINQIRERGRRGDYTPLITHCWLGFTEVACPILVHNHIVAILITGQLVTKTTRLRLQAKAHVRHPLIPHVTLDLGKFVDKLNRGRKAGYSRRNKSRSLLGQYHADNTRIARIKDFLRKDAVTIGQSADGQYEYKRARLEDIFRSELLGHLRLAAGEGRWGLSEIVRIMQRMSEFWAFRCLYLALVPELGRRANTQSFSAFHQLMCACLAARRPKSMIIRAGAGHFLSARRLVVGGGVCGRSR